jgi:hypothetical protein
MDEDEYFDPEHPDLAHENTAEETDDPADTEPVTPAMGEADEVELPHEIPDPPPEDQAETGEVEPEEDPAP